MYRIENISKKYGDLQVLEGVSIDFVQRGTTCILGPSGCGKTTILRLLSGLETPDFGTVEGFSESEISVVFQEDRLIPWKTVAENLKFVLSGKRGIPNKDKLVENYLSKMGLWEYKSYYPNKLSGGMKKRIAVLRAFIYPSEILLMDEPFSSIDISNKKAVFDFFRELMAAEKRTCVLVTHDLEDAIKLGDRIVILSDKPAYVKCVIQNEYIQQPSTENMRSMRSILEKELIAK